MITQLEALEKQGEGIIFPFSEQLAEAHSAFAARMWPKKLRRRDPAFNRWKFRGLEQGPVDGLLLAVVDGLVIGQLGLIPVTLFVDGEQIPAQWACDLMVDQEIRRKGVGSILLATGMNRSMITLGSNPSSAADAAMSRLGFKPLRGPRSMFLPLEPTQAINLRLPARYQRLTPVLARCMVPWITFRTRKLRSKLRQYSVKVVPWREVAPLIQELEIVHPHIMHDSAFLEWRCSGKPGFSPELSALKLDTSAFAIFQATPGTFYIYEWFANTYQEAQALFSRIVKLAEEEKSKTIAVVANSEEEQRWLSAFGFFTSREAVKVIYYPDHPLHQFAYFHYCLYDSDGNL